MNSEGIEIRPNGNKIQRHARSSNPFDSYYIVSIRQTNGRYLESQNNSWDYLYNARREADKQNIGK